MKVHDFFLNAIRAKAHWHRSWVIRAFAVSIEQPDDWKKDEPVRPWRIVRTPGGIGFINQNLELEAFEDADLNAPLFDARTTLLVPAGFFEHWPEGGYTRATNLLYNATCLWTTVGAKFGYENGAVNEKAIEKKFTKMVDDPVPPAQKDPDLVYVSDWLRYGQSIKYMEEFTQLFVWSLTRASVVPNPQVLKRKAELLEEHKHELTDPLVQSRIFKELEDLDTSLLQSDPGAAFVSSAKSKLARRKLTGMYGAEAGLDVGSAPQLITQSLHDGLRPEHMVDVMNVSRAGSFDRGSETMLGGVEAKWGDRVMSDAKVTDVDCKTPLGYTYTVRPRDVDNTVGRWMMQGDTLTLIEDEAAAKALIGKRIKVRTPARCAAGPSTTWCKYCLGAKLSNNPLSLGLAVSGYGSGFLQLFLQSMHSKATVTVRMRVRELMS